MHIFLRSIIVTSVFYSSGVFADSRITVDWIFSEKRLGSGEIIRSKAGTLFVLRGKTVVDTNSTKSSFGKIASGVSKDFGLDYTSIIRISNGNLVKIVHVGKANVKTIVSTNGVDACQARVTYFRSPGKRFFEANNPINKEVLYDTDQQAEDVKCVISNE